MEDSAVPTVVIRWKSMTSGRWSDARWANDTVTVVIPEFVVGHWYEQILHNQSALQIKLAMLGREHTVVTSVPYHVDAASADGSTNR